MSAERGRQADHDRLVERIVAARAEVTSEIAALGGDEVVIIAVTKTHPTDVLRAALEAGFHGFGESFATELAAKAAEFEAGFEAGPGAEPEAEQLPEWHFIGQLQTNKVRRVAPWVSLFQSVDRVGLVEEIARRVPGARILVQVNLAEVPGRGGVSFDVASSLIEVARGAGLVVEGVMGVAPQASDTEVAASFRRLRRLCDAEGLRHCSMGMSADYRTAVAEGSTMLRLGSILFGSRD